MAGRSTGRPAILAIGENDTSGEAGVPLMLRLIDRAELTGVSALTATAWRRSRAMARAELPVSVVCGQIDSAARSNAIGSAIYDSSGRAPVISAVTDRIRRRGICNVVLALFAYDDAGGRVLGAAAIERLRRSLGCFQSVVCCLPGASLVSGYGAVAVEEIAMVGARSIIVLPEETHSAGILYDGEKACEIEAPAWSRPAGTAVATRIACRLARGQGLAAAVREALRDSIDSIDVGQGCSRS